MALTLVFFANALAANIQNDRGMYPKYTQFIERDRYALLYDGARKIPVWVYEHLDKEKLQRDKVFQIPFKADDRVYRLHRSYGSDYKGSGYDRGHLAARANHLSSHSSATDTFYLSNVAPQVPAFNRGIWAALERYCRELVLKAECESVEVISGPLFLPKNEAGKRYVKYEVIGKNDVAVPTHFFKVIYARNCGITKTETYVIPNHWAGFRPLNDHLESLEYLEKASGLIFAKPKQAY